MRRVRKVRNVGHRARKAPAPKKSAHRVAKVRHAAHKATGQKAAAHKKPVARKKPAAHKAAVKAAKGRTLSSSASLRRFL